MSDAGPTVGGWQRFLAPIAGGVVAFFAVELTVVVFVVAFIAAALFLVAIIVRRDRWGWIHGAAIAWALYGVWEALIQFEITCDAECNIRVDLVLIYPTLVIASMFGAWRMTDPLGKGSEPPGS